ncbi:hypothetical protein [Brevibacillus reuszeri]|uniref:hypothetical protein n=1 Tax=Brevibacillus reuszeri TaxID=54915 RepID=UPI003D242693
MTSFKEFIDDLGGEKFKIIRNDLQIAKIDGLETTEKNTKKKYVGFCPDEDIQIGDWIIGVVSGNEFYIEDIKTDVLEGKAFKKKAYYLTKVQFENAQKADANSVHYNIGTIYGSNIGTHGSANITNTFNFEAVDKLIEEHGGEDKEELRVMVAEIKELFEDSEKVKKGSLSKFSEEMQKHSWITGALSKLALDFMMGQVK